MAKVTASFMCDPAVLKRIDALAKGQGVSRSQLLERWVEGMVEQEGMVVAAFGNPTVQAAFAKAFGQPGVLREMVRAMNEEMSPDQLEGFHKMIQGAIEQSGAAVKSKKRK